jgi:hypothetical protein
MNSDGEFWASNYTKDVPIKTSRIVDLFLRGLREPRTMLVGLFATLRKKLEHYGLWQLRIFENPVDGFFVDVSLSIVVTNPSF